MPASVPQQALVVEGLDVSYDTVPVVHGVRVVVQTGEAVAVIGSNGAGKTSMLRGIMRLVTAPVQRLELFGRSVRALRTHMLTHAGIGYVPEGRELFPGLTVHEELLIGGRRLPRNERGVQMDAMFAMFPRLRERHRQVTRTLSGGEQQMLAIARTLMAKPRLLLLDEPSLGLAPVVQDLVFGTLDVLRGQGLPMLLVEQNAFRALKLCSRAYVLELGRITREGSSAELLGDVAIQAAYLGR
jgi:ABC-type branched-subunit amino acid transport system ATPase component